MANIEAILSTKSVTSAFDAAKLLYLKGAIERDEDAGKFRLYPSPSNNRSFFLVDTKDVAGEVSEWTEEEVARKGLAGCKMYTVPISFGSVVQSVTIQNIQLTCVGPTGILGNVMVAAIQAAIQTLQNALDSDNEMSEMTSMRLQMLMDMRSKLLQTASDIEKSMSDTDMAIVGNIKQ
jgi:hypothetical protein